MSVRRFFPFFYKEKENDLEGTEFTTFDSKLVLNSDFFFVIKIKKKIQLEEAFLKLRLVSVRC